MRDEIVHKLENLFAEGIDTEYKLVYVLVAIRKLLERENLSKDYKHLKFYLDWALHAELEGTPAQKLLDELDEAHVGNLYEHTRDGSISEQSFKAINIAYMYNFKNDLKLFNERQEFIDLRPLLDNWKYILSLYVSIIKDCTLKVSNRNAQNSIQTVTINFDYLGESNGYKNFVIVWTIAYKNNTENILSTYHSF